MTLALMPATRTHLSEMMNWFPTAQSCLVWGGVEFRFPFTSDSFVEDCALERVPSFVLTDELGALHAFGQRSLRCNRCHLGRLAITPSQRGQGIGTRLVRQLAAQGSQALSVNECSLFVSLLNPRARALYERLGFRVTRYPDDGFDASAYDYMTVLASMLHE
jgi:ribosomal protein S18 acetylase RimI-like enzyme